jgi:hypothetical protein
MLVAESVKLGRRMSYPVGGTTGRTCLCITRLATRGLHWVFNRAVAIVVLKTFGASLLVDHGDCYEDDSGSQLCTEHTFPARLITLYGWGSSARITTMVAPTRRPRSYRAFTVNSKR